MLDRQPALRSPVVKESTSSRRNGDMDTPSPPPPAAIRWRKGELIGAGAYGRVYMGMNLDSGELLAVKQVLIAANSVAKEKAQAHIRELEEELKLLQNLSHPNIVRYLGTAREEDALNIFLEFVPGGSIASLLGKFGSFPESVIRMYTRQLLQGLEYLHKHGIMHRDIKGANILVDNKGCIKLADFGASKQVVELVTVSGAKSMKGTPFWMAPEVIRQTGHSLPADIWSVGCTVIEMATGKPPWSQQFQEVAALFHVGTTKSHPPIPEHLSQEAKRFLLSCLEKEPNLRPTATELLQHPFVLEEVLEADMGLKHSNFPSVFPMFSQEQPSDNMDNIKMHFSVIGKSKNENPIRRSLAFGGTSLHEQGNLHPIWDPDLNGETPRSMFGDDLNCSVRLDSVQLDPFSKSFNSTCDPSSFNPMQEESGFNMICETSSLNPMQEPTSYNPICEPHMEYEWDSRPETEAIIYEEIGTGANSQKHEAIKKDSAEFSFQCAPSEDDDEVTESKIRAFLDEKALELKRLQTPLYEEFRSIWNVAQKKGGTESFIAPLSPAPIGKQPVMNSRSPSKGSSVSGPSLGFSSRDSDASVSSDSPHGNASVNLGSYLEVPSPRLKEWKGLFQETQQFLPSPSILNSTERQKLWKEELQQELEMKREEKRMLARLTGNSKSSSPNSKSSSPNEKVLQRHGGGGRLLCASPTRLQV